MDEIIFVSYSRKDNELILPIVRNLEKSLGFRFWIDTEEIQNGSEYQDLLIRAIDKCSVVLFMLSENAIESEYVRKEVSYAKNIGKKVIPICLNQFYPQSGWFLFEFGQIDYIDAKDPKQIDKLIGDLSTWIKHDSLCDSVAKNQSMMESLKSMPDAGDQIGNESEEDKRNVPSVTDSSVISDSQIDWIENISNINGVGDTGPGNASTLATDNDRTGWFLWATNPFLWMTVNLKNNRPIKVLSAFFSPGFILPLSFFVADVLPSFILGIIGFSIILLSVLSCVSFGLFYSKENCLLHKSGILTGITTTLSVLSLSVSSVSLALCYNILLPLAGLINGFWRASGKEKNYSNVLSVITLIHIVFSSFIAFFVLGIFLFGLDS